MYVLIISGSVKVLEWSPFEKCFGKPYVLFLLCILVISVVSHFGFEDRIIVVLIGMMSRSSNEPHREKTGFLYMRKQRHRSASR